MSDLHTVEQHFDGKEPVVRNIYDAIVAAARALGPVDEDPKKTSIHLVRRTAFAGVMTRREYLILTVKADADIASPRVTKREKASANRWHHEVRVSRVSEVDGELKRWLRRAYEISA